MSIPILLVAVGSLGLFVWCGFRHLHHYDEFAYLYGAAHYSISALANGQFEPSNVPGFMNVKVGHLMLLRLLVDWFGMGSNLIGSVQAVYTALVVATCGIFAMVAYIISNDARRAMAMGAAALLIPVNIYLAPKLLAEIPGMFGAVASFLFFMVALLRRKLVHKGFFLAMSALALTYTILARQNLVLATIGGWAGLWVACPMGSRRRDIFIQVVIVSALCVVALGVCQWFLDLNLLRGLNLANSVLGQRISRYEMMRRVIYAFGPFLLMVPFAIFSQKRRELVFYGVWFLGNVMPMFFGFHYLEERFVVGGAPALAGLAVMGGEVIWRFLGTPRQLFAKMAGLGTIASILVVSNNYIQPKTIYEVDEAAYGHAMDWLSKTYPTAPILIPWSMSDYHFLRMAYPDAPVYLVNSDVFFTPFTYARDTQSWVAALKGWYATRYVGDYTSLEKLGDPPWIMLSWKVGNHDTVRFSWMQGDPRVQMKLVFQTGRYQVYLVHGADLG